VSQKSKLFEILSLARVDSGAAARVSSAVIAKNVNDQNKTNISVLQVKGGGCDRGHLLLLCTYILADSRPGEDIVIFTSLSVEVQSIAIGVFVCLSVCLYPRIPQ